MMPWVVEKVLTWMEGVSNIFVPNFSELIQWNLDKLQPEGIQISEMFGIEKCIWF